MPELSKQAEWKMPKPPKNDWDAAIKEAVDRGKEVPEIDWAEPGQDAAWKVRSHEPVCTWTLSMQQHMTSFKAVVTTHALPPECTSFVAMAAS